MKENGTEMFLLKEKMNGRWLAEGAGRSAWRHFHDITPSLRIHFYEWHS